MRIKVTKSELWGKFWKDKTGKVVLWQRPNLLLYTWLACTLLRYLLPAGGFKNLLGIVAFGAIFSWAYLEITTGVNYFRRVLGLLVLVASVLAKLP